MMAQVLGTLPSHERLIPDFDLGSALAVAGVSRVWQGDVNYFPSLGVTLPF